jgi:hypothetical protein
MAEEGPAQSVQQRLAEAEQRRIIGTQRLRRRQQRELVVAEPGDQRRRVEGVDQPGGGFLQPEVADFVAEAVVQRAQAVQPDQQQGTGRGRGVAAIAPQLGVALGLQRGEELGAGWQAGDAVLRRCEGGRRCVGETPCGDQRRGQAADRGAEHGTQHRCTHADRPAAGDQRGLQRDTCGGPDPRAGGTADASGDAALPRRRWCGRHRPCGQGRRLRGQCAQSRILAGRERGRRIGGGQWGGRVHGVQTQIKRRHPSADVTPSELGLTCPPPSVNGAATLPRLAFSFRYKYIINGGHRGGQ